MDWLFPFFALVFAIADRFAGSAAIEKAKKRVYWLPGSSVVYSSIFLAFALALCHPAYAWFAAAFFLWRVPPWTIYGHGGEYPGHSSDDWVLFLRHALIIPLAMFAAWFANLQADLVLALTIMWCMAATGMAMIHGSETHRPRTEGSWVEFTRGALMGLIFAADVLRGPHLS